MQRHPLRLTLHLLVALGVLAAAAGTALAVGTPAGTAITNQATVTYKDSNGNDLTALSNIVTTTVSQVASVDVSPDNSSSATPGDVLTYAHVVSNLGNGPDTIDLTATSSQGWTVEIYRDVNGNGTYESGTDTLLTDSVADGDGVPDTGLLAADGTFRILIRVTVPAGASDGTVDVTTVTGTSSFNVGVSESATDTTTIAAPALGAVKSVAPAGNQPPGTALTYTVVVTNNGAAAANTVVMTDPIPANTTYVPGSITYNGAGRTDASDGDNADFGVSTANTVTVDVGGLAAGASVTITFQVTIN
jgi:uncharacterized repeat protein (TIGR01451 family)